MENNEILKMILAELKSAKGEVETIKDEMKWIKEQQQEAHSILKALHNGEVNKAEHDKMLNEIAHIQEDLKNIYENVNAMKEIIGRHEVDIRVLKNRPV